VVLGGGAARPPPPPGDMSAVGHPMALASATDLVKE